MTDSQVHTIKIYFESLKDNALGDPAVRSVPVYLPPGYAQTNERYPVVYLLAGFTGRGTMMLNDSLWEETIWQRMDRLIAGGEAAPMIVVLPDGSTRYGGSQYIDSPATGNYEKHLLELVRYIDSNFRTLAMPEARGIAGKSSGGYGATIMGMHHPGIFGLVADHSGDKYFELCYKPDIPTFLNFYARAGQDGLARILSNPGSIIPKGSDFFTAVSICAMAACYSPNADAPLGFDLPFDPVTGELDRDVWARWEAHDPVNLVDKYADRLKDLKLLYIDCGTRDEYNLQYGARIFAQRLKNSDIPFIHEEFDDGHRGLNYRYDRSLALFSEIFRSR